MAKLPESNLSNYAVAKAIGASSLDVGALCTHPNVNKWSRKKPMQEDKPTEMSEEEMKNWMQGQVSKPYGLEIPDARVNSYYSEGGYINGVGYPLVIAGSTVEDINKASEWAYIQPKKSGKLVVDDEGTNIFARLPDFCGYDHSAKAPVKVDLNYSDKGGVTAAITIPTVADTYGGITLSDLGMSDYRIYIMAQTVDEMNITETGSASVRYMLGKNNSDDTAASHITLASQSLTAFPASALSSVMGEVNFFAILAEGTLKYEIPSYSTSTETGYDGYRIGKYENNTFYAYPKLTSLPSNAVMLEDSVLRVSFPDGRGDVIHNTSGSLGFDKSEEKDALYSWYTKETYEDGSVSYGALPVYLDNYDAKITITDLLSQRVKNARRRLTFQYYGNHTEDGTTYHDHLNQGNDGAAGSDVVYEREGYVPLITNLPAFGGFAYAAILVKYYMGTGQYNDQNDVERLTACIVVRYYDYAGECAREEEYLKDKWGFSSSGTSWRLFYRITIANVVNTLNQVNGITIQAEYGTSSAPSIVALKESVTISSYEGSIYPVLPYVVENTDGSVDYGDLYLQAPSDVTPIDTTSALKMQYDVCELSDDISL